MPEMTAKKPAEFYPKNRRSWRQWLERHHAAKENVWLVMYHKKSAKPTVSYDEAVEEALCFGWIDSGPRKRDDESSFLYFSRRKPRSNWSASNRLRVAKLRKAGLMMPSGEAMVAIAKKSGTWAVLKPVEKAIIPDDLAVLFASNKEAKQNFDAFTLSSKRIILEWILNAKRPETREKRIRETVLLAGKNIRANHYRQ